MRKNVGEFSNKGVAFSVWGGEGGDRGVEEVQEQEGMMLVIISLGLCLISFLWTTNLPNQQRYLMVIY